MNDNKSNPIISVDEKDLIAIIALRIIRLMKSLVKETIDCESLK